MLGERLRTLRESRGLTQAEVAKKFNISTSTIGMYEQGRRDPDTAILKQLAELYEVSTDYLLGLIDDPAPTKQKKPLKVLRVLRDQKGQVIPGAVITNFINAIPSKNSAGSKYLPIIGTIRAGLPILASEHIEDFLQVPEHMQGDFVLRVQGDSMIGAGILDGDLAICKAVEAAQSGQIVVALRDVATGFSEATLKYYYEVNGDGPVLRPANPQHQEIPMKEGYRIAGILVALIREEAPCYQVYRNYLAVNDSDEWTEVIEMASSAGIKPQHLKAHVDMLIEMGKTKE